MLSTLGSIREKLGSGEISSEELVQNCLNTIQGQDEKIGAFLQVHGEKALESAREIDRRRQQGEAMGALAGIPIAIKDNINIEGFHTTCASRMLENFISPYDATVIQKLKAAGAIFLGKTNMDEFAMGSSTEHSALRKTVNPCAPSCVPGGSSGGSTAAVAAGMAPLALGSSTGGSIRQPAAFCGVVGLKPTYGRVSRYGLVAFGSSLDQIGPIASDVPGCAELLQVIAGHDPFDSTSAPNPVEDFSAWLGQPLKGLRIGLVSEFETEGLQPEIQAALTRATAFLNAQGAECVTIQLPHTEYAIPTYYLIATAEASSNLARFDGVRYTKRAEGIRNLQEMYTQSRNQGFGMEVKRRILLGTYCLSSGYYEGYYLNAQRVRTKIIEDYQQAFQKCDLILAPTTPTSAFEIGEKTQDPVAMYLSDIFTVPANLAGIPAISFPSGKDQKNRPIGLQLMAPFFGEAKMLGVADHLHRHFAAPS
ncbi:MAG: Asp-tRNA(Asn)/Glu-tRNA(Gln) amidotransferase subunit GatA [Acidobacteria bacterium]|nr:Asp-tRNA(Asn)/Glu-tRNA(Gln) amidotransferase subunit GatA [Acidobacteriota bacterium]